MPTPVTRKGRLAQLARASVLHTEGQRFKSSTAHHFWLKRTVVHTDSGTSQQG